MKAPCKGCGIRVMGCHSVCDKYQQYKRENDQRVEDHLAELDGKPEYNKQALRKRWREMKWK